MRILWLTEFFPASNAGEITGGVEARCFFVSRQLRRRGFRIKIIAQTGGKWDIASWCSIPGRVIFLAKAFFTGLGSDFDLVEGTNFITFPLAWVLGALKRKPVVFWYADVYLGRWVEISGSVGFLMEIFEKLCLLLPGVKYIAISQATKSKLVSAGVTPENISVVYCGVDEAEINWVLKRKGELYYDIASVSRLLPYKRISDLGLAITKYGLKAAVVGQGPEAAKLKKIRGLKLFGYLPKHRQVLEIIKSAKIFCHPSVVEGFGIVIIEAMAVGLPVVAADIPVVREITQNGQGAIFFQPKNPGDLAEKVKLLLTDEKLYARKAREARALARRYTWVKIAAETAKVYESLHVD